MDTARIKAFYGTHYSRLLRQSVEQCESIVRIGR